MLNTIFLKKQLTYILILAVFKVIHSQPTLRIQTYLFQFIISLLYNLNSHRILLKTAITNSYIICH